MKMNIKIIIALISVLLLFIVVGVIGFIKSLYGTANINVNPTDTKYIINRKEYKGSTKINLIQGKYKITFKRDLFEDKTVTLDVQKGKEIQFDIRLDLAKDKDNNYNNLSDGEKEIIDQYDDRNAYLDEQKVTGEFPVINDLPYIKDTSYKIDYGFLDEKTIFFDITIDKSLEKDEAIKKEILDWFKSKSVDINKYKINYYYE